MKVGRTGSAATLGIAAFLAGCASQPPPAPPPARVETPEKPVETVEAAVYLVAAKTANVREGPTTSSATVAKVKKGDRLTGLEEKSGWLRVKLPDTRAGWIRKDLLRKDNGCLPDRREVLLTPPMLRMSDTPGGKGKVVVEAEIDDKGVVKAVKVVKNDTGSPERAEMAKSEVQGVTFLPPVKRCRVTGFTYVYSRTF